MQEPQLGSEPETLRMPARTMLAAMLVCSALFAIAAASSPAGERYRDMAVVLFALVGLAWLAGSWGARAGQWAVIVATVAIVFLICWWLRLPGGLAWLALPVAVAVALTNLRAAGAVAAGETLLLLAVGVGGGLSDLTTALVSAAGIWATLGLTAAGFIPLYQVVRWSWRNYESAQERLDEARDQRLALNQANEDLTAAYAELRRMSELLDASYQEAEAARKAKETFVANVSHEFRTPLNMIIGFTEMVLHSPGLYGDALPAMLLSDIGVIHRNSQHLAQLVDDVLDLGQLEAGQLMAEREWVQPATLVHEAVESVRPLYAKKGLGLQTELPGTLPDLFCDPLRIRQVLLNLLSNAGRFTDRGGVRVKAAVEDGSVVFSVVDSGPGIPPDQWDRLFHPFQQLDASTRRVHGGSGLGLSISKRLVELHGGRIWLESEAGLGATFSFSLPLHAEGSSATPASARYVHPYSTYEPRTRRRVAALPDSKPRVVVLEQEEMLCRKVGAYLRDGEVVRVSDGEGLRATLAKSAADLMLVNDVRAMEDKGFVQSLVQLPARMPVVSCYIPTAREARERLHVVDHLVKPVTQAALLAAAEKLVPQGGSILIVEDHREMARLMYRQLHSAGRGYRILRATEGGKALEILRERRPDAVFLDLGLPDQDGYQVLEQKNSELVIQAIPVVVVSARDPVAGPIVASRLRVEIAGGLSVRDIIRCAGAISDVLVPSARPTDPGLLRTSPG